MNHYKLPSQKHLKECLDYDSETGVFTWKKRPEGHFSTAKGMRISNRKYAGKKAGTKVKSHSGKSYLVIMGIRKIVCTDKHPNCIIITVQFGL